MRFLSLLPFLILVSPVFGQSTTKPLAGTPGPAPTIRIRCMGSIPTGEPLYIVDGRVRSAAVLKLIDPDDIKAIHILREEELATAIYGIRGRYGVVVILTKSGRFTEPDHVLHGIHLAPANWSSHLKALIRPGEQVRYRVNGRRVRPAAFYRRTTAEIVEVRVYRGRESAKTLRAGRADLIFDLITW